jgi:SAM-dependent methyltransferase
MFSTQPTRPLFQSLTNLSSRQDGSHFQLGNEDAMSKEPAKDFGAITDDYTFFETHATESEADVRAYATQLVALSPDGETIRMLDFGCGSGSFTVRFLKQAGWQPERLKLTLVEPAESVRPLAVERLKGFTTTAISDSAALPEGLFGCFDLVLANHVFYYVPDLKDILQRLISSLSPSGVFLTAIAGYTNALIEFWITGFGLIGREIPYNTSEDVETALRDLGANYQKQQVPYEVKFQDTHENRMRMIRFLLADHLREMPHEPLLNLFDKYSHAGQIEYHLVCNHYTLRAAENRR